MKCGHFNQHLASRMQIMNILCPKILTTQHCGIPLLSQQVYIGTVSSQRLQNQLENSLRAEYLISSLKGVPEQFRSYCPSIYTVAVVPLGIIHSFSKTIHFSGFFYHVVNIDFYVKQILMSRARHKNMGHVKTFVYYHHSTVALSLKFTRKLNEVASFPEKKQAFQFWPVTLSGSFTAKK